MVTPGAGTSLFFPGYVAQARHVDAEVVAKLGIPGIQFDRELGALRLYDGRGAVMVLKADPRLGSIRLESVRPGRTLADVKSDEEATAIAASVMRRLWRPAPKQHPSAAMSEFEGGVEWLRSAWQTRAVPFRRRWPAGPRVYFGNSRQHRLNPSYCTGICTTTTSCLPSVSLGSQSFIGVIDLWK